LTRRLIIGTRGSGLALVQTRLVSQALSASADLEIELRTITTRGERVTDRPISELGGVGVFTREIERALLEGEVDLAVHSLKDLPVAPTTGLVVAATPERADPRDVLCCREAAGMQDLRKGAIVGTSSPRRSAQLLALRPDLDVRPLRGNVDTRLRKLRDGDYDAIVVAKAALDRLGRTDDITEVLDPARFLPAPAQGALAVQVREGDLDVMRLVRGLNHTATFVTTAVERGLLERLGGGCHLPVGALAEPVGEDGIRLRAAVLSADGRHVVRAEARGTFQNPTDVVDNCFRELDRGGVTRLLS